MVNMIKKLFSILAPLSLIVVAGGLSYYWLTHKPRASRKPVLMPPPLVEVIEPTLRDHQTKILAMGDVMAAQSVNLNPRVNGMIISVSKNFIEGGLLKRNEPIVQIDPTDFRLAVRQKQSNLVNAKYNLKVEMGQQTIAQREFELFGSELGSQAKELVLRKPHLRAAKAAVDSAQAALEQAELDLKRTVLRAPFNAVVTGRNANIGSWVTSSAGSSPLVQLASTDSFWIDTSLPMDRIRWIAIPGINSNQGAPVKITYEQAWGTGAYRTGVVKRLKPEVEAEGRMAKLIVEVDDPLSLKPGNQNDPPMMLGTLVHVEIAGKTLNDVIELPENAVHDGKTVWLLSDRQTLDKVDVAPLWAEQKQIYVRAEQLPQNPKIIVSDLAAPVEGMRLRRHHAKSEAIAAK